MTGPTVETRLRDRAAWVVFAYIVSPIWSPRAAVYQAARMRGLSSAQMTEAWTLMRPFALHQRVGFTDSITPGSADNAMRMLRAIEDPAYLADTVIDCRFPYGGFPGARAHAPLTPGEKLVPSLGYQDVIDLSEAAVPAHYASALLAFLPRHEVISAHAAGVPVDYALRAAKVGQSPTESWESLIPVEYLV